LAKVTGIGGVFFKSTNDHKKLAEGPIDIRAAELSQNERGISQNPHEAREAESPILSLRLKAQPLPGHPWTGVRCRPGKTPTNPLGLLSDA
jgi:hypothetical protein